MTLLLQASSHTCEAMPSSTVKAITALPNGITALPNNKVLLGY